MRIKLAALVTAAILLGVATACFADDGSVLPGGVFRARVVPAYEWVPGSYNSSGTYSAYANGTTTVPNFGAALEYGVNDWITVGLQWAPGVTFDSNVPTGTSASENVNGLSSLFAGLMVQIVGPKAPVVSNDIRFALAPGVKIPFGSGADFSTQFQNYETGAATTVQNPDKQTLGIGGRAWLDYVPSKSFYLDLYSQFIDYPGTVALKDSSLTGYGTYATYAAYGKSYDPQVNYGYTLRLELDPHYIVDITDGIEFTANCAFRYDTSPDTTWGGVDQANTGYYLFSALPTLDFFFMKTVIPFELELDYDQPIAGVNTTAGYSLDLQVKVYYKF